eukprot:9727129-Alexandrium_andersonii.AAC.1
MANPLLARDWPITAANQTTTDHRPESGSPTAAPHHTRLCIAQHCNACRRITPHSTALRFVGRS